MKKIVKKIMPFSYERYQALEEKLEKYASEGLFLEKIGTFFWHFRKDTPRKVKYSVNFSKEGSVFNSSLTQNQQILIDYAEVSGWNLVHELNQVQIFINYDDNPVPFDTDEREKFENIKQCIKKQQLPLYIMMICIFSLSAIMNIASFSISPINSLSNLSLILPFFTNLLIVIVYSYMLISHFIWRNKTEKSLNLTGEIAKNNSKIYTFVLLSLLTLISIISILNIINLQTLINPIFCLLVISLPIILIIAFNFLIKMFKKMNFSARKNKFFSILLYVIICFSSLSLLTTAIVLFPDQLFISGDNRPVRYVKNPPFSSNFPIYDDEIPLKIEDIYPEIVFPDYSYKAREESSFLLSTNHYIQSSPADPASGTKDFDYIIYESNFSFVLDLVLNELLDLHIYTEQWNFTTEDAFSADIVFKRHNDYILVYDDKIVEINFSFSTEMTETQKQIIDEKLS